MSIRSQFEAQAARAVVPAIPPSRWPLPRHLMTDPVAVRERFAADMADFLEERGEDGVVDDGDLKRLGWTGLQIATFGFEAVSTAEHQYRQRRAG